MKTKTTYFLFAAILFCSLLIIQLGCKKDDNNDDGGVATVTTAIITNITQTTATSGGNVTDDGDFAVTARGVCWSINQNPTLSDNYTTDGSGTGTFISEITGLSANTTYYVRAYATNSEDTGYGNQETFTTQSGGGDCPATFTYQGQVYEAVLIGDQCWMAENLNIGTMINGSENMTDNGIIEKYCYDDDPANCEIYGGLYQWNEMMEYTITQGVQGICPTGWHLPTDGEWTILTDFLGGVGVASGKMKETGTTHWASPNTGATNGSGFTALPAGFRHADGYFTNLGYDGSFWSSTEDITSNAWTRETYYDGDGGVSRCSYYKNYGFSVRCLQD